MVAKVVNGQANCSQCIYFELEGVEGVCHFFDFVIEDPEPLCTAFKTEEN